MATTTDVDIKELFDRAQKEPANHKKYLKILHNVYQSQEFHEFFAAFNKYLVHAFVQPPLNPFSKAIITFASAFCLEIVTDYEKRMQKDDENTEYEGDPFFLRLMSAILKYVPLDEFNVRYHACLLLAMLFTNFGADISISDEICDKIQRAMLKRAAEDPKPQVRLQAIKVLTRLQNPLDMNCPVIQSFTNSLGDNSATVRKAVIESIAPCRATFSHIIMRLRDVDPTVRAATYLRLSKLSPKNLSIVNRQSIIMSGLLDSNDMVKGKFQEVLLCKWLNIYESNVINFMCALKLDANEDDIKQTDQIYERLLPIIFKTMSLQELVQLLELDETKAVAAETLTMEKATYWSCLISNLLKLDLEELEFEDVTPTIISMVACIETYVKSKSEKSLEQWEHLEHQQTLRKLFELMLKLDNSDEFGRQAMQKLVIYVLTNVKMENHVLNVVMKAFHSVIPDLDKLAYEVCAIIAEIKEPLEPLQVPVEIQRNQEIQIAQLKVKRHLKTDELKKAFEEKQYEVLENLSKEVESIEKQIEELENKFKEPVLVRKTHNDMDTVCRCLDIIISLIQSVPIETLSNSLLTFKDEFLQGEDIDIRYPGLYHRIFTLSCLYALIDKNTALQSLETICTPLIGYRTSSFFEKKILQTAVGAISDLIRIYGPDIFDGYSPKYAAKTKNNETMSKRGNDRTLYCEADYDSETEISNSVNSVTATSGTLIDIMLSMLDDNKCSTIEDNKYPNLRAYVAEALAKLVVRGLCVNSSLITRLLLKWFNPTLDTEDKYDQKVQRCIGISLTTYMDKVQNAPSVLEKAILPTLCYIGNAPKSSPLAEVNYEDILQCLIKFTKIRESTTVEVHKHLAYSILSRLAKTNDQSVRILTKMLGYLDIPIDEPNVILELSQQVSRAQENVTDKVAQTSLKKFYNKLNGITNDNDTVNTSASNATNNQSTRTSTTPAKGRNRKRKDSNTSAIEEATDRLSINDSIPQSKRSINTRRGKSTRLGIDNLGTIQEQIEGVEDNDSYAIQTPTTSPSSESSKTSGKAISVKRKKTKKRKNSSDSDVSNTGNANMQHTTSNAIVYTQSSSDSE